MLNVLHALFCLATPALAIWAADRFKPAKVLGPVVLAYAAGIILANLPGVHVDEGCDDLPPLRNRSELFNT